MIEDIHNKESVTMEKRNVFDILNERGFIEQATHEDEIRELLGKESVTFYIGFDPTADSLHIGHFIQVMVMMHMQQAGHRPIALVGAGTAKVGDPTGKTDMRKMLASNALENNANAFKKQLSKYINLDGEAGILSNNADWLDNLNYIDFIREIGSKFSVNRMLAAECFKQRLESGLSFLEFNYMIMQGYDFLELYRRHNCKLQLGGNDQWSNIIAGTELIRKIDSASAYGLTFKLLTTSEGKKMGKTEAGAVWIDPAKTKPYEIYQYFRNVDDSDVENCLKLLTFMPLDVISKLVNVEGAEINKAKERLGFEVTKVIHGEEEAQKSLDAAKALFAGGADMSNIPSTDMAENDFAEGMNIQDVMVALELAKSKGEAKRLIKQGGVSLGSEKVTSFDQIITLGDFEDNKVVIKKGKKVFHQIKLI